MESSIGSKELYSSPGYKAQAKRILSDLGIVSLPENRKLAETTYGNVIELYKIYRQNIDQVQLAM